MLDLIKMGTIRLMTFWTTKIMEQIMITKENIPTDNVNHPAHYTSHPSGVETIQIVEHMGFCLGNAVKYIMRCDEKGAAVEDLKKAVWYLEREIAKREQKD